MEVLFTAASLVFCLHVFIWDDDLTGGFDLKNFASHYACVTSLRIEQWDMFE